MNVTIHRPGAPGASRDKYNRPIPAATTNITATAERVAPTSAREISRGQQTLTVDAVAVMPAGTDVRDTDELTALGTRYRVVGVFTVFGVDDVIVDHLHVDLQVTT